MRSAAQSGLHHATVGSNRVQIRDGKIASWPIYVAWRPPLKPPATP